MRNAATFPACGEGSAARLPNPAASGQGSESRESAMLTIRLEKSSDAAAREALLDAAYGSVRFEKPSERLRSGRAPARKLSFVAVEDGRVIGTVRLWAVSAGSACRALLLGPLAVDPAARRRGIGSALMRHA